MTPRAGRWVIGGTLVAVGILYAVALFTDLEAGAVLRWGWPLILVALGLGQYAIDRSARWSSAVLVVAGLVLLGFTTGLFTTSVWSVLIPAILVVVGLAVILPAGAMKGDRQGEGVDAFAMLRGATVASQSHQLKGGDLTVIAGQLTVDLSEASPAPGARIDLTAVFAGCDIIVPKGWRIHVTGIPLLGGWDDTTDRSAITETSPSIEIRIISVVSGVEIRHKDRWK